MSGTGNTKRAAELIQLQLNHMNHECEIKNWVHDDFIGWESADAFGFAFPVHAYREPTPFKKKLKKLPSTNKNVPVFVIACCDGDEGNAFFRVGKRLKKKGASLILAIPYYTRSNVLMWEKMMANSGKYDDPKKDEKMLYYAQKLPELVRSNEEIELERKWLSGLFAALVPDRGLRYMIRGKIKVDETKCIKCGQCAKVCMAQCISLDPFPKIKMNECIACLGCLNLCPVDALNAKNTIGKERYKGPGKLKIEPLNGET